MLPLLERARQIQARIHMSSKLHSFLSSDVAPSRSEVHMHLQAANRRPLTFGDSLSRCLFAVLLLYLLTPPIRGCSCKSVGKGVPSSVATIHRET